MPSFLDRYRHYSRLDWLFLVSIPLAVAGVFAAGVVVGRIWK